MFMRFFENFNDFGLILGGLGLPKNNKKSRKHVIAFGEHLERIGCFMIGLGGSG